jgi:hypothetical protein
MVAIKVLHVSTLSNPTITKTRIELNLRKNSKNTKGKCCNAECVPCLQAFKGETSLGFQCPSPSGGGLNTSAYKCFSTKLPDKSHVL